MLAKRNEKLIASKFYQYLIPAVLMAMALQVGSLADGIVIGNFVGEAGLSASSLALPIIFLLELPGLGIAAGGSILAASLIAKRDVSGASKVFKLSLLLVTLISAIFIPIGLFLSDQLATALAGNFAELIPDLSNYIKIYLCQAPVLGVGLVVAYFLPADNHPTLGALYFIIGNVFHIGSEILFTIFLQGHDKMLGAAASMGIGMLAGLVVLIPYFKSKSRVIRLNEKFAGAFTYTKGIFRTGLTTMVTTLLWGVLTLVMNLAATSYLTDPSAMSLLAMLSNFVFVIDLFVTGVLQILPSLGTSLFGEKDFFGLKVVVRRVLLLALIITAVLLGISLAFPQLFFYIFGVDLGVMEASFASAGLVAPLTVVRVYAISFIFYTLNKFILQYYPSIFQNAPSLVNTIAKSGAIGPVLSFFLIMNFGVWGYGFGTIIIEAASFIVTLGFIFIAKRFFKKWPGTTLLLLPKGKTEDVLDFSFYCKESDIPEAVKEIQDYAIKLGNDENGANMLAVASEELLSNIVSYAYKKGKHNTYIDVRLCRNEDMLTIRFRDDGIPFDPTTYAPEEEFAYSGIEVIKKVASKFEYLRLINTNNTILEVAISK